MSRIENAVSCFKDGIHCAQAVLSAYGPELGLDQETALRVAAGFGGGTARTGETCGAVNGAIMVIGLKYGHFKPEDELAKEKTYNMTREFIHSFKSINGSIICKELLGCDINTPGGYQKAKDKQLFTTVCPQYVRSAAEIIEDML